MRISMLTVKTKIIVGFASVFIFLIIVSCLGLYGMAATNSNLKHITEINSLKIARLETMSNSVHIFSRLIRSLVLITDQAIYDNELPKFGMARDEYNKAFVELNKMSFDQKGKDFLNVIEKYRIETSLENEKFLELAKTDKDKSVDYLLKEVNPLTQKWQDAIHAFIELERKKNTDDEAVAANEYNKLRFWMILVCLLAFFSSLIIGSLITRSLLVQLGAEPAYVKKIANQIATGDLTIEVALNKTDSDSLIFAIKNMRDSFFEIVTKVTDGAQRIVNASGEISAGNMDLSSRSESQASSIEETAASIEELTSTVRQNADNARQANQLAASASDIASKGGKMVEEVITTMNSINESSKKIVDIIGVIDGIAFQTNILALNAAVEAARAGEQGRGFAVVASEVRNLAQKSANAAKEIKILLFDTVDKVNNGTKMVDETGQTIAEVVFSVRKVSDVISEITAASLEQTSGIDQINIAITQIDETTQQNAALVEQAAAAAQSLNEQAKELSMLVGKFKINNVKKIDAQNSREKINSIKAGSNIKKNNARLIPIIHQKEKVNTQTLKHNWEEF